MRLLDLAEMLLLAALWGGSFLFMRVAAPVLGPIWLIGIRVLLAGLLLVPFLIPLRRGAQIKEKLRSLLFIGAINSAFPFVLLAYASIFLPAGFTSILNATTPLFGMGIAALWFHERLTVSRLLGLCIGFVGVVVLIGLQPLTMTPRVMSAIAAGFLAAGLYAIAAPIAKQQLVGVPPLVTTTVSQLGAALVLLPLFPFTVPREPVSQWVVLSVLGLALLSTSLAYVLYFRLIENIGSSRALTVTYLIPVFAIVWGWLLLKEPITLSMVVGGSLVLIGTAISNDMLPNLTNPKS